jgi:hypothetical protein
VPKRSPILGYNHNVRHRGLLFHIQTEDSGVDNPHIFTHLFHGGVIISSRKLEYDRESAEDVVKSLMQAQHKASLKALKAGTFDDKISSYLADQPDLQPAAGRRAARDTVESMPPAAQGTRQTGPQRTPEPPAPPPLTRVGRPPSQPPALAAQGQLESDGAMAEPSQTRRTDDVSAAFRLIKREPTAPAAEPSVEIEILPRPAGKRRAGSQTGYSLHRTGQLEVIPEVHDQPSAPVARGKGRAPAVVSPIAPRPPSVGTRPAGKHPTTTPPPALRPAPRPPPPPAVTAPGPRAAVVVSRPAVIVGAPPRIVSPREGGPPVPRNIRRARESQRPSLFGKDLISERSLDEVILAYLSEDAQDK